MFKESSKKLKNIFDKYERYLSSLAMAIGFVVDNLTLRRIDLWIENLVIIIYLSIVVFCILYLNTFKKRLFKKRFLIWLNLVLPFALQFAFGGLFSAFMVFYSRSATLLVSWPFLLILLSLLLGNELFRERYERLYFHLSVLYLSLFAYSVFALPILLGRIGADVFLLSGGMSLLIIIFVIIVLYGIDSEAIKKNINRLIISITAIYFIFNFLYFTNIIPPIPLAMKAGGVYHDVARKGANYQLTFEKPERNAFWRETAYIYHWEAEEKVYVYSSIFAPAKFNEKIYHRWLFYESQAGWVEKDKLGFSILGGRDGGYRGYSYKTAIIPGKWRVDVITDRGQVLGRIKFEIKERIGDIKLEEKIE